MQMIHRIANIIWQKSRYHYQTVFWFLLVNFILTLIIATSYLGYAPDAGSFAEWAFVRLALVSNFAMIYLIIGLILLVMVTILPFNFFANVVSLILFWVLNVLILIDVTIFKLFRFHINSVVWNVLMTEGSADSVKLGTGTWITFSGLALGILGIQLIVVFYADRMKDNTFFKRSIAKRFVFGFLICILLNIVDKSIYAYGDLYDKTYITRYARLFPLYQPLTVKKYAKKKWGFEVNREIELNRPTTQGILTYPLTELKFNNITDKLNIVIILIDSWRYDMLNPTVTPNIDSFSKKAWVFRNHYSGGNSTRFGIFSLFYGLYGTYWHTFLTERVEPVLLQSLRKLGYSIRISSSTQLTFPEFRKTAFVGVTQYIDDNIQGEGAKQRDPAQADHFITWLDTLTKNKPFFAFLYLDAPHALYSYPEEFIRFKPSVNEINFMNINKKIDVIPFINDYKNAILFDDYVTGKILAGLGERGLLESTIVLITGDHGTEFYERGFWGHTSAFSPEQTKVPLILYIPGRAERLVDVITSHLDIPSTLLELMGCTTPPNQYSLGNPLTSHTEEHQGYVVSSGWAESALIDINGTIVFSTETYNITTFEVRNREYEMFNDPESHLAPRVIKLAEVISGMSRFLK